MMEGQQTNTSDADFLAGRDLAVRLLLERESDAGQTDQVSIEAKHREGAPQMNIALDYLRKLAQAPELMEGFAAVLTDGMCGCGFADADVYARLSIGEMRGPKHDPSFQAIISKMAGAA